MLSFLIFHPRTLIITFILLFISNNSLMSVTYIDEIIFGIGYTKKKRNAITREVCLINGIINGGTLPFMIVWSRCLTLFSSNTERF